MNRSTRSGALTAGLILIAIGVIFFIENIYGNFSAWRLLGRYWPLILILIGANGRRHEGVKTMAIRNRRPSLLGGLLWLGIGVLFLLHNFGIGPDFWYLAGRYWPILLILLGLGKVIDYYRHKEGVSLRVGEIFAILVLILIGTAVAKIANSRVGEFVRDLPINIGGTSVRPGEWLGTSYSYNEEATYTIAPSEPIRIENSYGLVSVSPGSDGEIRVRLKKVVYTSDESRAQNVAGQIKLEAGQQGKESASVALKPEAEPQAKGGETAKPFVITTNRDAISTSGDYRFNTDMEVYIPKKSDLVVRNSFGELRVSNIDGGLDVATSHNPLEVHDCSGVFTVSNRYAGSRLVNLTGNVTVDARGRVYLETIKGDVSVQDEYSPVQISDVDGKVSVTNTESTIQLERVTKPVLIDARGSEVRVNHLDATLNVTTSHRNLNVADVASNVVLVCSYSAVTLKDVRGNVDVSTNSDKISADGIQGYLKITGQGSAVRANTVGGPVDIRTTLKDVIVNNFTGGCKVTDEYADVSLSTGKLDKGEISVKNRNGGIDLFLPEGIPLQIDAIARNGRVDSDYAGLQPVESGDAVMLKASLKGGGPKIVLDTDYGNISVRSRGSESGQGIKVEAGPERSRRARPAEAIR
jgi:DUF4097 and DUF4098 domain-containing protein YvlB